MNKKGFTLIELLVIIIIIMLLGVVASSAFKKHQQKMEEQTNQIAEATPKSEPTIPTINIKMIHEKGRIQVMKDYDHNVVCYYWYNAVSCVKLPEPID